MITGMTVRQADGRVVGLVPRELAGELWYLKSWAEAGKAGLSAGNFTAITLQPQPLDHSGGGQTCWVQLGVAEIDWIKALNVSSLRAWTWACENKTGTLYLGTQADEDLETSVRWMRIALGSPDTTSLALRNKVRVLEQVGAYSRIAGVPQLDDYVGMSAIPGLVQNVYIVYPNGRTGEMPYYRMPLFDPATFKSSLGGTGLWLESAWLHSRV